MTVFVWEKAPSVRFIPAAVLLNSPGRFSLFIFLVKIKRDSEAERDLHLLIPFATLPLSSHLLHLHGVTRRHATACNVSTSLVAT